MWLALRFIHWPLDARRCSTSTNARVVVAARQQRQYVVAACPKALTVGIEPGMALADARLRQPELDVLQREPAPERAAMARLAGWAWGYSNEVHWAIADAHVECSRLVFEIGASLKLFHGQGPLLSQVESDLTHLAYRYRAGLGQSPQSALAFARTNTGLQPDQTLGQLPIDCLDLTAPVQQTLAASGIARTDALLALPPAALTRRFGKPLLDALERLQGQRPHGLTLYELPPRYDTRHELFGAVEATQGLAFVLRRVFDELAVFLKGADSAIQTLRLKLVHESQPETALILKLSAPSSDARHLERVAQERLQRVCLPAPVIAIELASDRLRRSAHEQGRLWAAEADTSEAAWPGVLDRIRARLGHDAVGWIQYVADHRPDHASRQLDQPGQASGQDTTDHAAAPPRPLWLLDTPKRLSNERMAQLSWVSGPERIESGWWDSGQRRDYYRVLEPGGRQLWIFKDLGQARHGQAAYYVHGLFG